MTRSSRTTSLPLILGIPAEHLAAYTEAQQWEIAKAQTCYMLRQQRLDARIPAYYNFEPIDAERLDDAVRILMGLFDAKAMPEVTLEGALGFASLLEVVAFEAEERRQRPALPMPYRFLVRSELDAVDALNGADEEAEERLLEPRKLPRRRRKKQVEPEEPLTPEQTETKRRRGGSRPRAEHN